MSDSAYSLLMGVLLPLCIVCLTICWVIHKVARRDLKVDLRGLGVELNITATQPDRSRDGRAPEAN